jgi:TolB protein
MPKTRNTTIGLLLAAVAGCAQYNGAPFFDGTTPAQARSYQQFIAQQQSGQAAATAPAAPAERSTITFSSPDPPPRPAQQSVQLAAATGGGPAAPLGLYGQLPQQLPERRAALDGPDNLRQVTFATAGADMDPRLDPSGKLLVYASTRHRPNPDIYLQQVDGTAVQQITHGPASDRMPTISPDGRQIAFASDRSGNWDIWLTDTDGSNPQQLTNDPTHELHPSFSPDGKQLVYCSYGAQSGQWELVVIDVANPAAKRFIGFGLFPDWSPNGNKIVCQRPRQRDTHWFSIWTMQYVNGEGLRPTEIAAASNAGAITPRWSPDGSKIVFCTVINPVGAMDGLPPQADVWAMNADGSGRVNLTQNGFANVQPTWAGDGRIYFVSNRGQGGMENIWSVRPQEIGNLRLAQPTATGREASAMVPTGP